MKTDLTNEKLTALLAGCTPGEWFVGYVPGPIVYGADGALVANLRVPMVMDPENRTNARLIAAAPELLAALVECQAWFDLDNHRKLAVKASETEIGRRMIDANRAAIAKAKGE